jgi:hypothetical protein
MTARPDTDLRDLDVEAAIARGLVLDGPARKAMFTEAAIAASWHAQDLGVGPYPLAFLARCIRSMGIPAALELPEPLIGAQPTALARDWMAAAAGTGPDLARDELFARWLETIAALIATRRNVAGTETGTNP